MVTLRHVSWVVSVALSCINTIVVIQSYCCVIVTLGKKWVRMVISPTRASTDHEYGWGGIRNISEFWIRTTNNGQSDPKIKCFYYAGQKNGWKLNLQITLYFCDTLPSRMNSLCCFGSIRLNFWFIYELQIRGSCAAVSEHACFGRGNTKIVREKKCTKLEFITHSECIRLDIVFCFSPSIRSNLSHLSLSAHKIFLSFFMSAI